MKINTLICALLLATLLAARAVILYNVDFGALPLGSPSPKYGAAATTDSPEDFWNYYTRDNGAGGSRLSGALTNLTRANYLASTVGVLVSNCPGASASASADPMYATFVYDLNAQPVTVTFTNLPAGEYAVYAYSPDGNFNVTVGTNVSPARTCRDVALVNPVVWTEGVQYVKFPSVVVDTNQPLTVTVLDGLSGYAQIAGLQVQSVPPSAPAITSQPTNRTVNVGGTTTFSVTATGTAPLLYQWRLGGTNILGATNAQLILANVQLTNAGIYSVTVSNALGGVVSSNAVLAVGSCLAPLPELTAWWRAEGNALDAGGTNHGSMTAVSFAQGKVGAAFDLNGNNSVVIVPSSPAIKFTGAFTIDGWVNFRRASLDANSIMIATKGEDAGVAQDWGLGIAPNQHLRPHINVGGSWNYFDCASPLATGTWYHVAMVYDGVSVIGYVNGVADGSFSVSGALAASDFDFRIGAYATVYPGFFPGLIDELALHSRALTAAEILAIYNADSNGRCVGATPPVILTQPTNQVVASGGTAIFSVVAAGSSPLTFQWRFNGTNMLDATNATLVLSGVTAQQAGNYSVTVANFVGSTNSVNANLSVSAGPAIVVQPVGTNVLAGANVSFSVAATGSAPLFYQWRLNGTNLVGATSSTLSLTNVQAAQAGNYSVAVSNSVGVAISSNALLSVLVGPTITSQSGNQTVSVGGQISFSVAVTGTAPLAFQWRFNGTNILNATNAALLLTNVQFAQAGFYSALVTNSVGSVASSNAYLSVVAGACVAPLAGLTAWWRAESNAVDVVGTNAGTMSGIGFNAGKVGSAFNFNGSNSVVLVPSSPANKFTNAFTIEAWVNFRRYSQDANSQMIVTKGIDAATTLDWGLGVSPSGKLRPHIKTGGSWFTLDCATTLNIGTWYHVAMVYSGTNLIGYVNGVADGSRVQSGALAATDNGLRIGAYATVYPGFFPGMIDELSLYNRALSASEVLALFNAGTDGKCLSPTPPTITAQPQNVTVIAGLNATFSVGVTGSLPISFQWRLAGTNVPGATNSPLILANVQPAQAGAYSVVVSNPLGTTNSNNANLTVNPRPTISFAATRSNLTLAWPTYAADFNLQTVTNLNHTWTNTAAALTTNGANVSTTFPATNQPRFFRLQHP
ncbi:MAG: hypothetical protein RLZZ350_2495 [Verrucomicrobiota bacterium]|jgi:hypothetical protein